MVVKQIFFIGTNGGVCTLNVHNVEESFITQQTLPKFELMIPHIAVWRFYLHNNVLLTDASAVPTFIYPLIFRKIILSRYKKYN
ncbi:MAG: hypothetical protein ACI936_000199 [Paraglaciecola sp.]|jgi:hypothetical protein